MKYILLFFFLIEVSSYALSDGESNSIPANHTIRKLPDIQTPRHIIMKGDEKANKYNEKKKKRDDSTKKKDAKKDDTLIKKEKEEIEKEKVEKENNDIERIEISTVSTANSAVGGDSSANGTGKFCEVYDRKIYDIVKMYTIQINKMNSISPSVNLDPQKYFCRAFSNVMLMEEGTQTPNAIYIATAKSDIKKAIESNKFVTGVFKIDIIEDRFLTAIFEKYNQIATKGMDDEQKALVANAITQSGLLALKQQVDNKYNEIDEYAGTSGTLQDKEGTDLTPYYSKNQLPLLSSITDVNGGDAEQTQTLRNFRVTEDEMNTTEVKIDEMLEVIQGFDM
jgi:hypothetical protein